MKEIVALSEHAGQKSPRTIAQENVIDFSYNVTNGTPSSKLEPAQHSPIGRSHGMPSWASLVTSSATQEVTYSPASGTHRKKGLNPPRAYTPFYYENDQEPARNGADVVKIPPAENAALTFA